MAQPNPEMSQAARARRRAQVVHAFRKGMNQREVIETFGLSITYVRRIAQAAGLSLPDTRGKRRAWRECPPHLIPVYDALVRQKIMKAEKAKQFLMGVGQ